ncbi:exo-beta-N-acetylmuramidase NamZ family protein [Microlunatus soli]|uniref:Uncharacterized conserved protein YbbC, DUF1343 family n=1 Tax=Microlunatus soli TaxID=630515 RepID=A0A1H1NRB0_9ACTN|nr:DUF1343 domain-containing protein [Microlunatus soli]SDS01488.1 Uncharacterized conserved protein YbbC, DUF1343 family [Microlunatus soli]
MDTDNRPSFGRRGALIGAAGLASAGLATAGLAAAGSAPTARADDKRRSPRTHPGRVRSGLQRLADHGYRELAGEKVGILTNPTGVFDDLQHEVDVLQADPRVMVTAVFGPEHGFRGTAQANDSEGSFVDDKTGLTVYDTFELSGRPLADVLQRSGVDTVLFDIADVGARFYTYIWTLFDTMAAAVLAGKRVVVLDRPNPLGGRRASGPVMRPGYETFVGRAPISLVHGMTVGELATLFNAEFLPERVGGPVDLTVIEMDGWWRDCGYGEDGLPWVLPSPNMPTLETAIVYPGSCLLSGTNLSQGRGTTRPFQIVGAPFVDHRLAAELAARRLDGLAVREAYFAPTFSTYSGENCVGIDVAVTDWRAVDAVAYGVALLSALRHLYPQDFRWRNEGTEDDPQFWIDNLTGSPLVREGVDAGHPVERIVASWTTELHRFAAVRRRYLRY